MSDAQPPLAGITVVEFSHMVMGPSAGLLLADKTASVEDRMREVEGALAEREAELEGLRTMGAPEPERIVTLARSRNFMCPLRTRLA